MPVRYELTIHADTHDELAEFINQGLPKPTKNKVKASQAAKANEKPPKQEKPKPKPAPEEVVKEIKEVAEKEAAKEEEAESNPEDNGKPLTLDSIKTLMNATVERLEDATAVRDTLYSYGVKRISDLDKKHFAELVGKLEAL